MRRVISLFCDSAVVMSTDLGPQQLTWDRKSAVQLRAYSVHDKKVIISRCKGDSETAACAFMVLGPSAAFTCHT